MKNKMDVALKEKYGWLNPNDVVFTPDAIAEQVVSMFPIAGRVLEPCKGEGAFLKYLPEGTEWCEIAEGRDFFSLSREIKKSLLALRSEKVDNVG
jgi:hypothetical protein